MLLIDNDYDLEWHLLNWDGEQWYEYIKEQDPLYGKSYISYFSIPITIGKTKYIFENFYGYNLLYANKKIEYDFINYASDCKIILLQKNFFGRYAQKSSMPFSSFFTANLQKNFLAGLTKYFLEFKEQYDEKNDCYTRNKREAILKGRKL